MALGIFLFVAALLVVVMVHESGHFLVAKLFGFKATKFFVGFGPTLWSFKRGETEYGVKAIPAGGFVTIIGMNPYEEVAPEDKPRSYPSKPRWQRALLLVAGSATHWVVAFVLLVGTALTIGYPTGEITTEIAAVEERIEGRPTPAAQVGLSPGDRIVAIPGSEMPSWEEIRSYIRNSAGEVAKFTVESDGTRRVVEARVASAIYDEQGQVVEYAPEGESVRAPEKGEEKNGFLGVQPEQRYARLGFFEALADSGRIIWRLTIASVQGVGEIFSRVFNGELLQSLGGEGERQPDEGLIGIVGAGRIAGESIATGQLLLLIELIVGFTVFVGLLNLLPLPPLDGGHLAVLAYEAVTRRDVDLRKVIPLAAAVISFFVILTIAVLYLDLARPVDLPF